ncbi:MAG: hypothetical protein WDO70_01650 [Alphaproteobacteria bacterium]
MKNPAISEARESARHVTARRRGGIAPALIARAADPAYTLVEMTTPEHLQDHSDAVDNCAGRKHNSAALRIRGLSPHDPEAKYYLHYAIKIRQGKTRLFALHGPGGACAVVEYDVKRGMAHVEGPSNRAIGREEACLPALCDTLHQLSGKMEIGHIDGLPFAWRDTALTRTGQWVPFSGGPMDGILIAHIAAHDETPQEALDRLSQSPRLTLDVTELSDLRRLPPRLKATLYTNAPEFNLSHVEEAGVIWTGTDTKIIRAEKLEAMHDLLAYHAKEVHLPALRRINNAALPHAALIDFPELEILHDLSAAQATRLRARKLKNAHHMRIPNVADLDAAGLRNINFLHAENAEHCDLSALQGFGSLYVPPSVGSQLEAQFLKAAGLTTVRTSPSGWQDESLINVTRHITDHISAKLTREAAFFYHNTLPAGCEL